MITGGFGTMLDLQRGTMRRWYMGRDGVKRWADNDEPVTPCTSLPDDVARCAGIGSDAAGWREGCASCRRRTSPAGERSPWITPPPIIAFECEFLLIP